MSRMHHQKRQQTRPAPIVVAPSQDFYGPDGSWSTFRIEIGSPPQSFDVIASTASSEVWVPIQEGCTASDPTSCADLRGAQPFNGNAATGFQANESNTYQLVGLYAVETEKDLGIDANAQYGKDVVGFNGGNGSDTGGVSLAGQIVAAIADKDYFLGGLGLGIQPTSFSSGANNSESFMVNLKNDNLIPSLSYGYTAGAAYRPKRPLGDLVLGGYDQSRFTASNKTFTFSSSDAEVLTVGVQSIIASDTILGTASFTANNNAHMSVIDSTVPHLWLPRRVCDLMESALGLQYDNQSDLYLVNDTIHTQLLDLNPQFTFTLGNTDIDTNNGTNIVLPYAAFDLQVGWPIYSTPQNYFPIRRAANESQHVLGRALLQEAYLVVDYERRNFTLGQATFDDPMPASRIITISPQSNSSSSSSNGLSTGAIIGIAVGIGLLAILSLAAFILLRRRRRANKSRLAELDAAGAGGKKGMSKTDPKYEALDSSEATEMSAEGEHRINELAAANDGTLAGAYVGDRKYAPAPQRAELASPRPVYEMMGDSHYEMEGSTPVTGGGRSVPPSPYQQGNSPAGVGGGRPSPYGQSEPSPRFSYEEEEQGRRR